MARPDTYGGTPSEPRIIVTGNPVDGLRFYGPFPCAPDAIAWAESQDFDEWWCADIEIPAHLLINLTDTGD